MYLLFDIGGTKMRIASSDDGRTVDPPTIIDTPKNYDEAMQAFQQTCEHVSKGNKFEQAAGGIAGIFDRDRSKLMHLPNLGDWNGKNIKDRLQRILGCDVILENDADVAGLGEAVKGAGKGYQVVSYITVGTGIGGARIVNGKIDKSTYGFEPGHQYIDADESYFGKLLDLEEMVSGGGLHKRLGKSPKEIDDESVWGEVERFLSFGLYNTVLHWSPEVVVLGGGLIRSGKISVHNLTVQLKNLLKVFPESPKVVRSILGYYSGLYGALQLVQGK